MDLGNWLVDGVLIKSLALTILHFSWQGLILAVLLKLSLFFIDQQKFYLRYRIATATLLITIAAPVVTFYWYLSARTGTGIDLTFVPVESVVPLGSILTGIDVQTSDLSFIQNESGATPLIGDFEIVLLWGIGVIAALSKFLVDVNKTYRLTRVGVRSLGSSIESMAGAIKVKMRVGQTVTFLKSDIVNVPVVVGFLKPVILLPAAVAIGLDREQLALILAHELAHVKRRDFLVNILQGVVQVIFFYHPCVYWINRVIREEREFICDKMAIEAQGESEESRLGLAKALLNTAELKQGNFSLVAVSASGGHLRRRIYRIVSKEYSRFPSANGIVVLLSAIGFSFAAMAATSQMTDETSSITQISDSSLVSDSSPETSKNIELDRYFEAGANRQQLKKVAEKLPVFDLELEKQDNLRSLNRSQDRFSQKEMAKQQKIKVNSEEKVGEQENGALVTGGQEAEPLILVESVEKEDAESETDKEIIENSNNSGSLSKLSSNVDSMSANTFVQENASAKKKETLRVAVISPGVSKVKSAIESTPVLESKPVLDHGFANTSGSISSSAIKKVDNETVISRLLRTSKLERIDSVVSSDDIIREVEVKDLYTEPRALNTPYPSYPAEAFLQKLKGKVKVDFIIDENGNVDDLEISNSISRVFVREIKNKLRRWKYEPATKNGVKVAHQASMLFEFDVPEQRPYYKRVTGSRLNYRIRTL
ncbi:TonB family protein [Aliikangiella sp. G2MR2-5]|uniref:TonB family protein n=1 Tax=Aliikangiella sp. G2MR2-5 TaxID=2788943 RepID=UPI0018AB3B7E|nr:TonB family protein [Aliikangiella sp. G2MR2-5]